MDLGLKGRTAIVSGASSGLGLATAEALAGEGANVTMFARRREVLEREADRIGALAVRGDVTNPRDLSAVVQRTVEAFGGLDILVWNSGGPPPGPATAISPESVEEAVELLLAPLVRLVELCLPHLAQSEGGRILVFTSSAVKEPTEHLALSNTIRPGVTGYAKSLARELGPQGVTVNCVAPGRIDTARLAQLYPDGHPARTLGHAAGVRRCRLLPRVRPRALRDGRDCRRRRRPDARVALMRSRLSPLRFAVAGAILLVAVFAYMVTQKSDKLLEVPDKAHPLSGLINVPGSTRRQDGGGIYYVDVVLQKASLLQAASKLFRPEGADLISQN